MASIKRFSYRLHFPFEKVLEREVFLFSKHFLQLLFFFTERLLVSGGLALDTLPEVGDGQPLLALPQLVVLLLQLVRPVPHVLPQFNLLPVRHLPVSISHLEGTVWSISISLRCDCLEFWQRCLCASVPRDSEAPVMTHFLQHLITTCWATFYWISRGLVKVSNDNGIFPSSTRSTVQMRTNWGLPYMDTGQGWFRWQGHLSFS